jgi:D-alanyl-D-alanine carboxypeptidase
MRTPIVLLMLTIGLAACVGETVEEPRLTAEIAGIVEAWAERTPVPGVVVAMHGDVLGEFQFAYGTLTRDGVHPVEVSSPFRVASITKTLVAVVILQLVEEGRISLGDEVLARLTDEFLVGELPTLLEGVTVGDLLAHTSGLPDSARSRELADALKGDPERRWKTEEVLGLIADRDRESSRERPLGQGLHEPDQIGCG